MKAFQKRVSIRNKYWMLKLIRRRKESDLDGWCSHPEDSGKSIVIDKNLPAKKRLQTIIHETTHASQWDLDEEWIEQFSEDLTNILYDTLDYRSPHDA